VLSAGEARAQDTSTDGDGGLEDIIVTADRPASFGAEFLQAGTFRNARQLDTPLTVNVVPRDLLDAQAARSILDALRNTAGVTRAQLNGSTYDNLSIRGIVVENRGNYRLNGSLPIINLIDLPLENKDRVEVLKGASALYYGFTAPSGIVNLTMKRAKPDRPVTDVTAFGAADGTLGLHGDVARRFGTDQQFGARVNLLAADLETGVDQVDGWRMLASGAFDWQATETLRLSFDVEHIRKTISETAAISLLPAVNGVVPLPAIPDPRRNLAGEWQKYRAEATHLLARADWKPLDWLAVTLEVGQARTTRDRNFSQFQNYNLATGNGTLRVFFQDGQVYRNRNVRAEVSARITTGPITHDLTVGATLNERFQDSRNAPTIDVAQNLFTPRIIAPIQRTVANASSPSEIEDRGLYVFNRANWNDRVQLIAGVRLSDYDQTTPTRTYSAKPVSPGVALVVKPMPWLSLYGTYVEGLEEGGNAPANAVNALEVLPPATSEQWEGGIKAELNDRLLLTAAYFSIDRPSAFLNAARVFALDGRTRYQGVELAASGEVAAWLSLYATALFLDAEQTTASDPLVVGRRPENTARVSGSLFAEVRPVWLPGLGVSAGVFHVGSRPVNARNQAFVDGYTTLNLGARYTTEINGRSVTFQINGENVTGARYWNAAGNGLLGVNLPSKVSFLIKAGL
jgi:iron complex outermembrane receptor protein